MIFAEASAWENDMVIPFIVPYRYPLWITREQFLFPLGYLITQFIRDTDKE
jgi:hypothetical protein